MTGTNYLSARNQELYDEWHPSLNGDLKINDYSDGSSANVWWRCKDGHEWQARIDSRTCGSNCPYCSNIKPISERSLHAKHPMICKEWHPDRNKPLTPLDVFANSNRKVWWKCKSGHEWEAVINSRTNGHKCPYCTGRKFTSERSLGEKFPRLIKEWNIPRNGNVSPFDVTYGSRQKVWWICEKNHEWEANISRRSRGSGCPYCSGKKLSKEHSLGVLFQELSKEWHPDKNGSLKPEDVFPGSAKFVWWICKHGHTWKAKIYSRKDGRGCPYCSGVKAADERSFLMLHPDIAKEWHPKKNGDLTAADVTFASNRKVWWICEYGHEWMTYVNSRHNGRGCPYCSGWRCAPENSIAVKHPDLIKEWDKEKNKDLSIFDYSEKSHKEVWWICIYGHEWKSQIKYRVEGYNCPYCFERRVCHDNNLAFLYPHISCEWNGKKNNGLSPYDVLPSSSKTMWWICSNGHEWKSTIKDRVNGNVCPYCSRIKKTIPQQYRNTDTHRVVDALESGLLDVILDACISQSRGTLLKIDNIINTNDKNTEHLLQSTRKEIHDVAEGLVEAKKLILSINNLHMKLKTSSDEFKSALISSVDFIRTIKENEDEDKKYLQFVLEENNILKQHVKNKDSEIDELTIANKSLNNDIKSHQRQKQKYSVKIMELEYQLEQHVIFAKNLSLEIIAGKPVQTQEDIYELPHMSTSTEHINNSDDSNDYITCMECGLQMESLDWHIKVSHAMDSYSYRKKHNLPDDFLLVAGTILNRQNLERNKWRN